MAARGAEAGWANACARRRGRLLLGAERAAAGAPCCLWEAGFDAAGLLRAQGAAAAHSAAAGAAVRWRRDEAGACCQQLPCNFLTSLPIGVIGIGGAAFPGHARRRKAASRGRRLLGTYYF